MNNVTDKEVKVQIDTNKNTIEVSFDDGRIYKFTRAEYITMLSTVNEIVLAMDEDVKNG